MCLGLGTFAVHLGFSLWCVKQLFIRLWLPRKEMDTRVSDNFQGHTVGLLKHMRTQAALASGLPSWGSFPLAGCQALAQAFVKTASIHLVRESIFPLSVSQIPHTQFSV